MDESQCCKFCTASFEGVYPYKSFRHRIKKINSVEGTVRDNISTVSLDRVTHKSQVGTVATKLGGPSVMTMDKSVVNMPAVFNHKERWGC